MNIKPILITAICVSIIGVIYEAIRFKKIDTIFGTINLKKVKEAREK